MIKIKAAMHGIPFNLFIDGKNVVWEGFDSKTHQWSRVQWYPPISPQVFNNIDKAEYMQWHACRTEEQVYSIIKMDLIKNACEILGEEIIK